MKLVICASKTSEYTQTHVQYTNLTPTTTKNMNLNKFPFFLNHICRCVCLCYGLVFNSSKFSHLMSFSAFLFILISSFFYYVVMIFPLLCWSWLFVESFLPDLLCSSLSVFSPHYTFFNIDCTQGHSGTHDSSSSSEQPSKSICKLAKYN